MKAKFYNLELAEAGDIEFGIKIIKSVWTLSNLNPKLEINVVCTKKIAILRGFWKSCFFFKIFIFQDRIYEKQLHIKIFFIISQHIKLGNTASFLCIVRSFGWYRLKAIYKTKKMA